MKYKATSAKLFLETASEALLEVERVEAKIEDLRERRDYYEKMRLPKSSRKIQKIISLLNEEIGRLMGELKNARKHYLLVGDFIAQLEKPSHRVILRTRYLRAGKNWQEISDHLEQAGMPYSMRSLTRLHKEAMVEAEKLWEQMKGE